MAYFGIAKSQYEESYPMFINPSKRELNEVLDEWGSLRFAAHGPTKTVYVWSAFVEIHRYALRNVGIEMTREVQLTEWWWGVIAYDSDKETVNEYYCDSRWPKKERPRRGTCWAEYETINKKHNWTFIDKYLPGNIGKLCGKKCGNHWDPTTGLT